jgi:hypothetical protein
MGGVLNMPGSRISDKILRSALKCYTKYRRIERVDQYYVDTVHDISYGHHAPPFINMPEAER